MEIAHRRGVGQLPSQLVLGHVGPGRGDFTPLLGNNLVKDGHKGGGERRMTVNASVTHGILILPFVQRLAPSPSAFPLHQCLKCRRPVKIMGRR